MADQRITQLTALPKAGVAATDVLPIADISASQTKKVTAKDLVDAGLDLIDVSSIDIDKLDQASATKLGTAALADDAVTAAKLANDSSIAVQTTAPVADNFEGRGFFNSTTNALEVFSAGSYVSVAATVGAAAVDTAELVDGAVTTAKVDAAGLAAAALATDSVITAKIADGAVTAAKIATGAVTADEIGVGAVTNAKLNSAAVTYAKIQNVSVTDRLLGRSTAGAGSVEEIPLTAAGRALLDDANNTAQRATLGLGTIAVANTITAAELADDAVTAAKLANNSSVNLITTLPGSGAFVGQIALDTDDDKAYIWNGATWTSFKAAGSVNTIIGDTAGIVNIAIGTSGDTVTITTSLDDTTGAAEFLTGPTGNAGVVGYRQIVGTDLPEATAVAKGAVIVDGEGLRMNDDNIEIDNDIVASVTHHLVTYDDKGLIAAGRIIQGGDLPAATPSVKGGVIVGTGLAVDGTGLLNHANNVVSGTAAKVTFDSEGHVTGALNLDAADVPDLNASKITTGTFDAAQIGTSTITGAKLANFSVSKFGETQPVADHIGQFFFNPLSRDLFLFDGNVYQPIGISIGEIVFAGTFDASLGGGTGLIASVTAEGTAIGLTAGQALPAATAGNSRYYLVVSVAGTITSGNAPNLALSPPDIVLSNGTTWTEIDVSQTVTAQVASNVSFTPAGNVSSGNVQLAIQELDAEKLAIAGGTMAGELLIGITGSLAFEGATDNAFETTLAVVDPTADRTITLPNVTGTVVTTGDSGTVTSAMITDLTIVNADISASAGIVDTKLATIATGGKVSNSATTATNANTASAIVARDASGNFTAGTITANLTGTASAIADNIVTSAKIVDGTIVNADINAGAAIAGTKIVAATTSVVGAVQLTDSTSSTSTTTAATPAAVKAANDLAVAALPKAGGILTGDVTLDNQFDLRFREATANGTNFVGFQAPASIAADVTFTLPATSGTVGQVLSTNGTGTLDWVTTASETVIAETKQVIDENYTLSVGFNGVSAGPVEVAATYAVTVPAGATWVII